MVPTLVVIDNSTGKIITSWGMEAIEYNQHRDPKLVVDSWRQGNNSVPIYARLTSGCVIS